MMDVEQIRTFLPHRYPMLLVDRILEFEPAKRCVGLKNVTINEEFFNGHFPGQAMMPGVLIVEAMAQVGGVLVLSLENHQGKVPVLGGIEGVRFRRPVVPGDTLITEVEILYFRKSIGKCKAIGRVNGQVVATAEIVFALLDKNPPAKPPASGTE